MPDLDQRVRLAAFVFLDRLQAEGELMSRAVLQLGLTVDAIRVPLMGPQGIFKPQVCDLPLSITTVAVPDDQPRPYDDTIGPDGLLRYRYRGDNPNHPDNVRLREAGRQQRPLIYFHGIVPGRYLADYPVFVVGDDPQSLTFTVSVDERRFAALGSASEDPVETEVRRRYATRLVRQRLHQRQFRERVLDAYRRHCAVCRLKRDPLLQAAHIIGDSEDLGVPAVSNGISLCSLHHAAFDAHLIAVRTDYRIEVRRDVLDETDGPMLIHGLQGFHDQPIRLPVHARHHPDRDLLQARYTSFLNAGR